MSSPPAKRPRLSQPSQDNGAQSFADGADDLDTDTKLAILSSLFPLVAHEGLLEVLITCEGSLETAQKALGGGGGGGVAGEKLKSCAPPISNSSIKRRTTCSSGAQALLSSYLPTTTTTSSSAATSNNHSSSSISSSLPKLQKGKPLLLFKPEHVSALTPCTLIPRFLPAEVANELLLELVEEANGFVKKGSREVRFVLGGKEVWSKHTAAFYVRGDAEVGGMGEEEEGLWYTYSGVKEQKRRVFTERMERVAKLVEGKVREVILERWRREIEIRFGKNSSESSPQTSPSVEIGRKKYESPHPWTTNAAIVNCYDGGTESVGWHADQVTYLGPMATIASVSLGVGREFGLKRQCAAEAEGGGVVKVWLPHNSLLIMEAGTQEEWKHCIYPAPTVSTHPLSGPKRINITYRYYRPSLAPKYLPKCRCDPKPPPGVLKTVMDRRSGNCGRYFWTCQGAYQGRGEGGVGCGWFEWAEWDEEGEMKGWREKRRGEEEIDKKRVGKGTESGVTPRSGDDGIVAEREDR